MNGEEEGGEHNKRWMSVELAASWHLASDAIGNHHQEIERETMDG
jgi:hypothetical protein